MKAPKKLFVTDIGDPMFGGSFYFIVGPRLETEKFLAKKFKSIDFQMKKSDGALYWQFETVRIIHFVLWLPKFELKPKWIAVLAHELDHFCYDRMLDAGVRFSNMTEEVHTNYKQMLFTKVLRAIWKKYKKK